MATINIKIAGTEQDFEQGKILFEEYASSLDFDLGYQDFKKELSTIAQQYKQPDGALLLCFADNENAAGCAGVRKFSEGIAELKRLYVKPDYRSLKIGKRLLEKCEMEAKSFGFNSLELVATLSGEKLYTSNGYIPLKSYEVDLGNGITNKVVSMYKRLL